MQAILTACCINLSDETLEYKDDWIKQTESLISTMYNIVSRYVKEKVVILNIN